MATSPLPTPARRSHRAVVEHVDVFLRDVDLNARGRDVSHRRCAGGNACHAPSLLSLPGGTLTLAAAVVAVATIALGAAR